MYQSFLELNKIEENKANFNDVENGDCPMQLQKLCK